MCVCVWEGGGEEIGRQVGMRERGEIGQQVGMREGKKVMSSIGRMRWAERGWRLN